MKKTSILLGLMTAGLMASAQAPVRMSLFEEFTGENCNPCAATNPGLNTILAANASQVIAIKWQVPIPSAPTTTWSLYQTDKPEIDWRMGATPGGFGYGFAWTNTDTPTSGIQAAPTGVLDGQHQWTFGAAADHPAYLSAAVISSAQAQPTNFSIVMTTSWSPTYTNCLVNASITAAANFTALANMKFRLVLVERTLNFPTPPGSNGEKDFVDVARKSYPTTMSGNVVTSMGTAITNTWTAGQTVTLQISCNMPSYLHDLSQAAFVGFVQDDVAGTAPKPVYQAARTAQPSPPNDMKYVSLSVPFACTGTFVPTMVATNIGTNAVTALTVTPYIDGAAQPVFTYTNSIAAGASVTITLSNYSTTPGSHNFGVNISNVSGGDFNIYNNSGSALFGVPSNTVNTPVTEPFATFPPVNWYVDNVDAGPSWAIGNTGGYGNSPTSAMYNFYYNGNVGDADNLNFPAFNTSGLNNINLSFDVAYAQYTTENDKLEAFYSIDCGNTWNSVYSKQGTLLATAPAYTAGVFVPNSGQWRTEHVPLPNANNQAKVLMKFVATSAYGNNLYVDNVNLASVTGIKQNVEAQVSFELYPNPASTNATIKASSASEQSGTVTIYNTLGQVVKKMNVSLNAGINEVNINTADLSAGVYNVVMNTSGNSQVKKLTISK